MKNIIVITSSLRKESTTRKTADYIVKHIGSNYKNIAVKYLDLANLNIPRCDGRKIGDYNTDVANFNTLLKKTIGIIICYPVYGQSFPAILKDLLDCTNQLPGKLILLVQILATDRSFLALESITNYLLFGHNAMIFPKYLVFKEDEINRQGITPELDIRITNTIRDFIDLVNKLTLKGVIYHCMPMKQW
jgi:NAD(P)H-dependent FMN reductase